MEFLEKDIYEPVKNYLEQQGYEVQGEVKNCDLVAFKDDLITVIELKKSFNLKLLYQAIDRQSFAHAVYVAIGRDKTGMRSSNYKNMIKLLKRLNIGLITVSLDGPIKIVQEELSPFEKNKIKNGRKKKAISNELEARTQNVNIGGVTKTKIITAYTERAIELLCILEKYEIISYSNLRDLGYDYKFQRLLYDNFYGWFEKVNKATYGLSGQGIDALDDEKIKPLVEHFRKNIK